MHNTVFKLLFFFVLLNPVEAIAQQARIVFYNVENLFDTRDDSLTSDEEFLPQGEKHWTNERMHRKIVRIYQVLAALGEGEMPAVVGLCEIENREALNRLIYDTPLNRLSYRVIHRESPDARGVDVALLYRTDIFKPDSAAWLNVPLPDHETTREILMVRGRLWDTVTAFFYVNHWPSRYGGAGGSSAKRLAAASTLAVSVKQVLQADINANIIVMGDFNDEPGDESLQAINKILMNENSGQRFEMVNLSARTSVTDLNGTIKHQGTWSVFDQVIVSPALVTGENGCMTLYGNTEVFKAGFLLETDETYTGVKPFRTYSGPGYNNGFSDHLPVSLMIEKRSKVEKD
jgi:predicted extracellular nuclease